MAPDPKSFLLTEPLHRYLVEHGTPPDPVLDDLTRETAALGEVARMQTAPEQVALLTLLTRALGVQRAVEVGTFTGTSALAIARGLPSDGTLVCCDVNEEWTAIGRRHWERAGVADRIDLRIAPALDTLRSLPGTPPFDLAFVDADKPGYLDYVNELARLVRRDGLILVDNVLWSGRVLDPADHDEGTEAIRRFNDAVAADGRFETVMVPIADGVTFLRVR